MGQNPRTEGEIPLEDPVQNTACPVQLRLKENTLTAWLCGEIDHHTARKIREAVDETASRVRPERLILDFSAVQFMDSSGIGLIMGIDRILDMARTAVNITGDAVCTTIVAHQDGALDKNVFNKK